MAVASEQRALLEVGVSPDRLIQQAVDAALAIVVDADAPELTVSERATLADEVAEAGSQQWSSSAPTRLDELVQLQMRASERLTELDDSNDPYLRPSTWDLVIEDPISRVAAVLTCTFLGGLLGGLAARSLALLPWAAVPLGMAIGGLLLLGLGRAVHWSPETRAARREEAMERFRAQELPEIAGADPEFVHLTTELDGLTEQVRQRLTRQEAVAELRRAIDRMHRDRETEDASRRVHRLSPIVTATRPTGMADPHDVAQLIDSPAERRVSNLLRSMTTGSIAVVGPPGSGRSRLVRSATEGVLTSGAVIGVTVTAPPSRQPFDLVEAIFRAVVEAVRSHVAHTEADARSLRPHHTAPSPAGHDPMIGFLAVATLVLAMLGIGLLTAAGNVPAWTRSLLLAGCVIAIALSGIAIAARIRSSAEKEPDDAEDTTHSPRRLRNLHRLADLVLAASLVAALYGLLQAINVAFWTWTRARPWDRASATFEAWYENGVAWQWGWSLLSAAAVTVVLALFIGWRRGRAEQRRESDERDALVENLPAHHELIARGEHQVEHLSYADAVASLRTYCQEVTEHLQLRLVIGLDDIDQLANPFTTNMVEEVTRLFDLPDTVFVVSLSDEVLTPVQRGGRSLRQTFGGAFDHVVSTSAIDLSHSRDLVVIRTGTALSDPFIWLVFCLSAGVPDDLIRLARTILLSVEPGARLELPDVAQDLTAAELATEARSVGSVLVGDDQDELRIPDVCARAAEHAHTRFDECVGWLRAVHREVPRRRLFDVLVVHADMLATVRDLFDGHDLERRCWVLDQRPAGQSGSLQHLATVRQLAPFSPADARFLLDEFRATWALAPLPPADLSPRLPRASGWHRSQALSATTLLSHTADQARVELDQSPTRQPEFE